MTFLRQWLLGVIACALLVSLAEQLCPPGSVRKVLRLTGGLLLTLAMLRPLATIDAGGLAWDAGSYREAVARLELELVAARENALSDGIAAELEAYIEDKAACLGAEVRAEVHMGSANGVPAPESVTLRGAYSAALSEAIASELGVAKEKQTWIGNG